MEKEDTTVVVPRRRFPAFRSGTAWRTERMDTLYSFKRNNAFPRDKLNYENGTAKNIHYGDIHTKLSTLFDITKERVPYINAAEELPDVESDDYCIEGDLIFADASEDTNDVGKCIEVVRLDGHRLLAGQHTILARQNSGALVIGFGGYLFQSAHIRSQIQKEAQGTKVYGISSTRLARIEIAYPGDKEEQERIADCLTSLDAVILAQGRKVEALKTYKRGLMQQLFPREGDVLPRLRFPEFRNGPGWTLRRIGDLLKEVPRPIDMEDNIEYSLVTVKRRYGGVVSRERLKGRAIKVKSQFVVSANDFLISKRQIVHNACGLVPLELDGSIVSNEYSVLGPKSGCDIEFFNIFSQQPYVSISFLNSSVGIVIEKMLFKLDVWLKHEFLFPPFEEQKKIAAFFRSIEKSVVAESNKHDALRAQKKGLMQQLFPKPVEAG